MLWTPGPSVVSSQNCSVARHFSQVTTIWIKSRELLRCSARQLEKIWLSSETILQENTSGNFQSVTNSLGSLCTQRLTQLLWTCFRRCWFSIQRSATLSSSAWSTHTSRVSTTRRLSQRPRSHSTGLGTTSSQRRSFCRRWFGTSHLSSTQNERHGQCSNLINILALLLYERRQRDYELCSSSGRDTKDQTEFE